MNERNSIIAKLLITHLIPVPALIIASLVFSVYCLVILIIAQTLLSVIFLAGYREFFGRKFWNLYFVVIQMFLILIFSNQLLKFNFSVNSLILTLLFTIEILLLLSLFRILRVIFGSEKENFEIAFPLQNGKYLITDGGNSRISRLMNYHFHSRVHKRKNTNQSMLFATDIIKTDKKYERLLPLQNENYPIFGENIYCPMDGTVIKIVDDIDDNEPFSGNYPYNTGNTVVIKKDNYYLLAGHLKKESITVKEGDSVSRNDLLAQCGNSGMSERPHLHMQLIKCNNHNYWKGIGINMTFEGKNLYKNRVISIRK